MKTSSEKFFLFCISAKQYVPIQLSKIVPKRSGASSSDVRHTRKLLGPYGQLYTEHSPRVFGESDVLWITYEDPNASPIECQMVQPQVYPVRRIPLSEGSVNRIRRVKIKGDFVKISR